MNELNISELIAKARNAMEYSYSPYSQFRVGAALITDDGNIYTGCNIENASYGATNCAERTAMFKAVSEGKQNFLALAVICGTETYCSPCGICRQVMVEFSPDMQVVMANIRGEYIIKTAAELLPGFFSLEVKE